MECLGVLNVLRLLNAFGGSVCIVERGVYNIGVQKVLGEVWDIWVCGCVPLY